METLCDYDFEIRYHEGKANVVADALSRKQHEKPRRVRALRLELRNDLMDQIREAQELALSNLEVERTNERNVRTLGNRRRQHTTL